MKIVGSRLGRQQYRRSRARAVLCRVIVGKNLELLNVVDRREDGDTASEMRDRSDVGKPEQAVHVGDAEAALEHS